MNKQDLGESLHIASEKGDFHMLREIVSKGADVNYRNSRAVTPLMVASGKGYYEACRTLLDLGADANAQDGEGRTPLSEAAKGGWRTVCELLIKENARVDESDKDSNMAIHHAASNGHLQTVRLLAEHGLVAIKNKFGATPFKLAIQNEHSQTASFLLEFVPIAASPTPAEPENHHYDQTFKHVRILGQGGFGIVFEAEHKDTKTRYAIKRIRRDPTSKSDISMEVKALTRLRHPNIIVHYDSWEENPSPEWQDNWDLTHLSSGNNHTPVLSQACLTSTRTYLYIQMELCRENTLETYFEEHVRSVNQEEFISIFRQILSGVKYIHNQGYIHRDLKPANIYFSPDGCIKLGDFGLAKQIAGFSTSVSALSYTKGAGTYLYMSPEQMFSKCYDFKTDVFTLGVLFCQGLVSCSSTEESQLLLDILRAEKIPAEFRNQNPPARQQLLSLMVRRDHTQRPTAEEIEKELDSIVQAAESKASSPVNNSGDIEKLSDVRLEDPKSDAVDQQNTTDQVGVAPDILHVQSVPVQDLQVSDNVKDKDSENTVETKIEGSVAEPTSAQVESVGHEEAGNQQIPKDDVTIQDSVAAPVVAQAEHVVKKKLPEIVGNELKRLERDAKKVWKKWR